MDRVEVEAASEAIANAVHGAVLNDALGATSAPKIGRSRGKVVSPINGAEMPLGRAKGVPNKVTRTIREAVELAAQPGACHKDGLAGWLIDRARGSVQDRQIFAAMVNKAMPLQVQAQVGGGIKLELSWLGGRNIGTTTAQIPEQRTQVLDLQAESDGTYRIKDPSPADAGTPAGAEGPGRQAAQDGAGDAQGGGT